MLNIIESLFTTKTERHHFLEMQKLLRSKRVMIIVSTNNRNRRDA